MANSSHPTPVVGMGCTLLYYTDRKAATIVEVVNERKIAIQEDIATRIDSNGMSESQAYTYSPNPEAAKEIYTLRKNGRWVRVGDSAKNGQAIGIGYRKSYHDYSF